MIIMLLLLLWWLLNWRWPICFKRCLAPFNFRLWWAINYCNGHWQRQCAQYYNRSKYLKRTKNETYYTRALISPFDGIIIVIVMRNADEREKWTYFDVKHDKWGTKIFHCIDFILLQKTRISFLVFFPNQIFFCFVDASTSILIATCDSIQPKQLINSLYDFRSFQFHFRHPATLLCAAALQCFDLRPAQVWVISESFTQLKNFQVWNSPTQSINNLFQTTATAAVQEKKKKFAASCEL